MYSAYDREILAIYEAVMYFRHMLEARNFTVLTDHKPSPSTRRGTSVRLANSTIWTSSHNLQQIRHISGQEIVVADALFQVEAITAPVTHDVLAAAQEADEEQRKILAGNTALQLVKILIPSTSVELYCDTSSGKPRPYVPSHLRLHILNSLHSLSHPTLRASAKLVSQLFVWSAFKKDCRTCARACKACQRSNVSRHNVTQLANSPLISPTSYTITSN